MKKQRILAMAMAASMLISNVGITAFAEKDTTKPIDETVYEGKVRPTMSPEAAEAQNKIRQEQEMLENYSESAVLLGETAELSADTVTVSGTITLGSGMTAKEDGRIGIYLYELKKDGNRIIEIGNSSVASGYADIDKGDSKTSYSFTAPKGNYAVGTRYYSGKAGVVNSIVFYNSDGTVLDKELAEMVELTSNKKVNITIPKAERTISGTITFENPPAEDTYFYVDLFSDNAEVSDSYQNIPVSAGAKSVDYSLGVSKGSYEMYAYISGGDSQYYSVYGDLRGWEDICYINTTEKSVTGIDFVYSGEESESSNKSIDVNVKLASKAAEDKKYVLFYEVEGRNYKNTYTAETVYAGDESFTRRMSIPQNKEVYVGVFDRTYVSSSSDDGIAYYYSEQFGVTTDKSVATPVNVAELDSIDITFPKSYELSGTVSRNGIAEGEQLDLYVIAQWDNEKFYTNVRMSASENTKDYTINIPAWAEGVELSVYSKLRTVDMGLEVEASSVPVTVIASANMAKTNISAPPSTTMQKLSGTVSFGAPLPDGGAAVTISYFNMGEEYSYVVDATTFLVKAGATSFDYSIYVPVCESTVEEGKFRVRISAEAAGTSFDGMVSKRLDPSALADYDVTMPYLDQTVSGKIVLPSGMELTSGMTVEVYVEYTYAGSVYTKYTYASVIKGESSAYYSVNVPADATLNAIWLCLMTTGTLPVIADDIYYSPDGATGEYTELSIPLKNGYNNADIKLEKANMIMGSIIVPDDFEGAVSCSINTGGGGSHIYIDAPGVYPYSVSVPDEMDSTILQFYFREEEPTNYYTGRLYYKSGGLVYNSWEAEEISMADGVVTGIDIEMIKGTNVTGKLTFEEGAFLDGEIDVSLEISNDYIRTSRSYSVNSVDGIEYSLSVPAAEDSNVTLSVEVYNYDNAKTNIASGEYYYAGVELVDPDRWSAVEIDVAQGYEADLIIPIGKKVSGRFILPDDAKGSLESAQIYFEGKAHDMSARAYPDETGYYEVYVFPDDYWYSISTYPNEISEMSNIKQQTYYYVDATHSTTNYDERGGENLTNGAENINFYLETGKTVSGTVILPDGITGDGGMYIMVEDAKTMEESDHYIHITENGTEFMITPMYMTDGDVIISYYIYGIDGIYDETLYYTSSGPTLDSSKAELVSVGEGGIENIELKAIKSRGTVTTTPIRMNYGNMGYLYADTFVVCDNGYEQRQNLYIYDYETRGDEREFSLPEAEELASAKSFNIAVEVEGERWYLTENGDLTKDIEKAKDFEMKEQSIDVPIPDKSINYPDDIRNGELSFEVTSAEADTKSNIILVQSKLNANNIYYDDVMPGAYIGVYDGDKLVEVITGEYYITGSSTPYNVTFEQQYQLEMCVSKRIDKNYTYKLFTWNNLANAAPLADVVEIAVQ